MKGDAVAKPSIALPVVVEGRYDKIKLSSIVDADIITTDGFAIFNQKEKTALLRRLAEGRGVIVLTDPDGGGRVIRSYLAGVLRGERVYHLHIPAERGKERRKKTAGRAGLLGVEGTAPDILLSLLAPFTEEAPVRRASLTKADLYTDGLSGGEGAKEKRAALAVRLSLPPDLSPNALLAAINLLFTEEDYRAALRDVTEGSEAAETTKVAEASAASEDAKASEDAGAFKATKAAHTAEAADATEVPP